MSRHLDIGGWVAVAAGLSLGVLAGWVAESHGLSENTARVAAYTAVVFGCLALALRPAWRRLRMWGELFVLLGLHVGLLVPLVNLLNAHTTRLNWALALPFAIAEFLLLLGVLWRGNVTRP
jgi:hypothetical protein